MRIPALIGLLLLTSLSSMPACTAQPAPVAARSTRQGAGAPPARNTAGAAPTFSRPTTPAVTIPPASPRVRDYNRTWYALYFADTLWGFLGLIAILWLRVATRLRAWAERVTRWRLLRAAAVYAPVAFLLLLWNLPPGLYGFHVEHSYGFSRETLGLWFTDQGRDYLFGLITIPVVWLAYRVMERSPKRWWLWFWLGLIPIAFALIVVVPVVIDPAYNHFRVMAPSPLRDRLVQLADRAGVHGAKVYIVDISRRTTKLNAYVTGLGPTKRIVIWDTTLKALPEDEVVAIVGHELGHYVLGHIWWSFWIGVVGAFVLLWMLSRLLPWAVARYGPRLDIRGIADLAGLPLAMLILSVLLFLQTPIANAISRYEEHQADAFGLHLTHMNVATARAFITFIEHDYADPDPPPFIVFWLYTHPPIRERVQFALSYPE